MYTLTAGQLSFDSCMFSFSSWWKDCYVYGKYHVAGQKKIIPHLGLRTRASCLLCKHSANMIGLRHCIPYLVRFVPESAQSHRGIKEAYSYSCSRPGPWTHNGHKCQRGKIISWPDQGLNQCLSFTMLGLFQLSYLATRLTFSRT